MGFNQDAYQDAVITKRRKMHVMKLERSLGEQLNTQTLSFSSNVKRSFLPFRVEISRWNLRCNILFVGHNICDAFSHTRIRNLSYKLLVFSHPSPRSDSHLRNGFVKSTQCLTSLAVFCALRYMTVHKMWKIEQLKIEYETKKPTMTAYLPPPIRKQIRARNCECCTMLSSVFIETISLAAPSSNKIET